jgi:sec-independent protein translocase protein TatA
VFGHGWLVFVVLLVIVLVVFGPGRLGQVGGALGRSIKEFRKSQQAEDKASKEPDTPGEKKTSG